MTSPRTEDVRAAAQEMLDAFLEPNYSISDLQRAYREGHDAALAEVEEAVRRWFSEKVQHYDLMVEPDDSAYMELDAAGRYVIADEAEEIVIAAIETARRNPR